MYEIVWNVNTMAWGNLVCMYELRNYLVIFMIGLNLLGNQDVP